MTQSIDIKTEIENYLSKQESIVSEDAKIKDKEARFTTFGHIAACKAIYKIIKMLDEDTKVKVLDNMRKIDI